MDLNKKFDYIERTDLKKEFMDAYWLAREVGQLIVDGDNEGALEAAISIYPILRFILENASRYEFALNFIESHQHVLDVPCGTGYGTVILGASGARIYGIDIDEKTVAVAQSKYDYHNVSFDVGDMMECKYPKIDAIVCFEGLEHVTPGEKLIKRFARALPDTGKLIISVPINEEKIRPDRANPYHLEKYDSDSFSELLESNFSTVMYFGTDVYGSVSDARNAFNGLIAVCEV